MGETIYLSNRQLDLLYYELVHSRDRGNFEEEDYEFIEKTLMKLLSSKREN